MTEYIVRIGTRTYLFYSNQDADRARELFRGQDQNDFEDKMNGAHIEFDYELDNLDR